MEYSDNIEGHKVIVFCVDHYNPLGLIRSLGEGGYRSNVILVSSHPRLIKYSKYINALHQVDSIEEGYELLLSQYASEYAPPFVFTANDTIEQFLDERYNELKNRIIFFDGASQGQITKFMDKHEIMMAAKSVGLTIPQAEVVPKGTLPSNVPYPVITKSITSNTGGWKEDVYVCKDEQELLDAYSKIKSDIILVEEYIEKKNELCLDGISFNGGEQVYMPLKCNYLRYNPKSYGNYMLMSPFKNNELQKKIQNLFQVTRFTGIFSIEFLIDKKDRFVFLEINFRHSTWGYSSTYAGANLPVIWAHSVLYGIPDLRTIVIKQEPFTAMAEFNDFIDSIPTHRVSILKWIIEYIQCPCKYVYNSKDRKPLLRFLLTSVLKRLKLAK